MNKKYSLCLWTARARVNPLISLESPIWMVEARMTDLTNLMLSTFEIRLTFYYPNGVNTNGPIINDSGWSVKERSKLDGIGIPNQ